MGPFSGLGRIVRRLGRERVRVGDAAGDRVADRAAALDRRLGAAHQFLALLVAQRGQVLDQLDLERVVAIGGVVVLARDADDLPEVLTREQAEVLALPPRTLSLTELLGFIANLEERGQNAGRYRLALWQKLSLPVMTAAMIMLSLPFVFGPARSASLGWRIMAGAIIGVAFFFLNQILGYAGLIIQISPAWTTFVPALALLAASVFVSRKIV